MKRQRLNYFFWQGLLLTTSIVFINKPVRVVAGRQYYIAIFLFTTWEFYQLIELEIKNLVS